MGLTYRKHPFEKWDPEDEVVKNRDFVKVTEQCTAGSRMSYGGGAAVGFHYRVNLRPNESVRGHRRQYHKYPLKPCKCCFHTDGRIWMLKGSGRKSRTKTKGIVRETKSDLKDQLNYS
jgi:hypothetical protein